MTLGNPIFGNTFSLDTGTISKRSLDGTLLVGVNRNRRDTYQVAFRGLSVEQRDQMISFMYYSCGQQITLTDHEGFQWLGFIVDQEPIFEQEGRGCNYNCSFVFEGTKL